MLVGIVAGTVIGGAIGYARNGKEGLIDGLADGFMWSGVTAFVGAAARFAVATWATHGSANAIGKAGEKLAHIDPNAKEVIKINGRNRIPDAINNKVLIEVKNVKSISNTLQLRDFAEIAAERELKMILYVRPNTKVAKSVIEAGWRIRYLW